MQKYNFHFKVLDVKQYFDEYLIQFIIYLPKSIFFKKIIYNII